MGQDQKQKPSAPRGQKAKAKMNASKIIISKDGQEYLFRIYDSAVIPQMLKAIAESPAGKAGSVPRAEGVAVTVLEQAHADGFATDNTTHRKAWRAIEQARKDGTNAFALIDGKRFLLAVHKGALNGRKCYSGSRYIISGAEYVLCRDGHFEAAENRDSAGKLIGFYDSVILSRDK